MNLKLYVKYFKYAYDVNGIFFLTILLTLL